mmetsp:Transcript_47349/g.34645  ORF Transcript_47349/g.34645 Transcript_47349/m.34645 type:complete len:178 (-) Transcript_47349:639-1172(-)|eukprot:CAMPEP_0202969302 /NCGR_PEP_ID=MMETSP1396-20130829/14978_1 /ASSEMBLY_ACC=CAM_ASM_000872 /TAXON_ID= /ORGANISM="Pseudokeronopsis sp., Strain Brazil" /LENGTH=177 /DNA_ID=CAMNT_0049696677 /DNA_START=55 /DNA_END=588 /DNA_ORIENTATION=+
MIIYFILNLSFLGLCYQTFKGFAAYKQVMDTKQGSWTKEVKEQRKQTEDLLSRILLKWITAVLFFKGFWIIEKFLFLLPTSLIHLWIGLWITLPNFHGEAFFFNLISDKLEKFEYYMRLGRNKIVQRLVAWTFKLAAYTFASLKQYLRTDLVKGLKEEIGKLDAEMAKELVLRKAMT